MHARPMGSWTPSCMAFPLNALVGGSSQSSARWAGTHNQLYTAYLLITCSAAERLCCFVHVVHDFVNHQSSLVRPLLWLVQTVSPSLLVGICLLLCDNQLQQRAERGSSAAEGRHADYLQGLSQGWVCTWGYVAPHAYTDTCSEQTRACTHTHTCSTSCPLLTSFPTRCSLEFPSLGVTIRPECNSNGDLCSCPELPKACQTTPSVGPPNTGELSGGGEQALRTSH